MQGARFKDYYSNRAPEHILSFIMSPCDVVIVKQPGRIVGLMSILFLLWGSYGLNADAQTLSLSPSFLQARQDLASSPVAADEIMPAAPQYDVVALRVSFQADTSRLTTGNGTFEGRLFETLTPKVDPLPHNFGYFNAHLRFLENYVSRVSDGQTTVTTHIIPEVVQVSQEMAAYSPIGLESGSDAELAKLAGLVEEAWALASQQSSFDMSGFDPATTAFILFHAGVGRDIELVGTTLDKTPQDLPTIFFDSNALSRLLSAPVSFNGFPVNHTLLLPRTETRQGFDFIQDEPFLVEFSINGLLAASFFNFLGVPDLFDTSTGESAIGPFGLMDPLGLFAYNGLFPPEPSAWTKQYLGWTEATLYEGDGPFSATLNAASGADPTNELARVPISNSEYFLLENRYRDRAGDGLNLTIYRDGQLFEQQIENGQDDFNSFNVDGFDGGVVVDVDDFDWALPGGRDEDGNDLLGGMLIWHIDENVIRNRRSENGINSDPNRRGVDLEEADSAQDLGFPNENPFAPQSHLGSPFDFYYLDNPVLVITSTGEEVRLYQNRFGPSTFPNSNSNADGPSFVVIDNFTAPSVSMSVQIQRMESASIGLRDGFPTGDPSSVPPGSFLKNFSAPGTAVTWQSAPTTLRLSRENAVAVEDIEQAAVFSPTILPDGSVVALARDDALQTGLVVAGEDATVFKPLSGIEPGVSLGSQRVSLLYDETSQSLFASFMGIGSSDVFAIAVDDSPTAAVQRIPTSGGQAFSLAATDWGRVGVLTEAGVHWTTGEMVWPVTTSVDEDPGELVLGSDASGLVGAFTRKSRSEVVFLQGNQTTTTIDVSRFGEEDAGATISRYPVLVDLDGDQRLEVLVTYGRSLLAFRAGGGLADGFPVSMPSTSSTQPLIASFASSEGWSVLVGADDGYLYGFDLARKGRSLPNFPLSVGKGMTATPLLDEGILFGVDAASDLRAWELSDVTSVWWGQHHGNPHNTNFVRVLAEDPLEPVSSLLEPGQTYNWPNPIRNGETFFRVTPSQDVRVVIRVIDAAGNLIDEIVQENVRGNTATDIPWQSDLASGLYFARVKAVAEGGESETQVVKIAVIR